MRKYCYLLASTLLIFSCTDQDSLPENKYAYHRIPLNEKEFIQIEGDGITYERALKIATSIQSNIASPTAEIPVDKATYKSPEELSFTEFPWWDGSYYWENFEDLNIQFQTYTVAFTDAQSDTEMIIIYQKALDKKEIPVPFIRWQWYNHLYITYEVDDKYYDMVMTCMRARLYGTSDSISKETVILGDEIRKFEKMECILDNDDTRVWVNDFSN